MQKRKRGKEKTVHFKEKKYIKLLYAVGIFLFVGCLSIAYGALNTELSISGDAVFRTEAEVRITNFRYLSSSNNGVEEYNSQYSTSGIMNGIALPNLNSKITYEVTITNFTNDTVLLKDIINQNFNNDAIEYVLIGISKGDIMDKTSTVTFQITFQYKSSITQLPENITLGSRIDFIFTTDKTPPIISEIAGAKHIYYITKAKGLDVKSLVIATDDVDGDITNKVTFSSSPAFDSNKAGTYTITYYVSDAAGNVAKPYTIKIVIWDFIKIDSGDYHTLALTSHGQVYGWGYGATYRLGFGNTADVRVPTRIPGLENIIDISAAKQSSYAVDKNGNVFAWGSNGYSRLGDGTTTNRATPTKINFPEGVKIKQISAHFATVAALSTTGEVYTWGWSAYGGSGMGTTTNVTTPTLLPGLSNIKKVNMGYYNGAAIDQNGELYVWGTNGEGQIGIGKTGADSAKGVTTYYNKPNKYNGLTGVKDIGYGINHATAVLESGEVYTWGANGYGRIGNGTDSTNQFTPTKIAVEGANACSVNEYHNFVLTSNDEVYAWGGNNYGEVGVGYVSTAINKPTLNPQISNIKGIATAFDSSFVLSKTNEVYGMGYGGNYVLGNNAVGSSATIKLWGFVAPEPE